MAKRRVTALDIEQMRIASSDKFWRQFFATVPIVAKWAGLVLIFGFLALISYFLSGKATLLKMDVSSTIVDLSSLLFGAAGIGWGLFERNARINIKKYENGQLVNSYDAVIGGVKK